MSKGKRHERDERGFSHDWYARLYAPTRALKPARGEVSTESTGWGPGEGSELLNYPQWLRELDEEVYEECKVCHSQDSLVIQETCPTCLDEDNLLTE